MLKLIGLDHIVLRTDKLAAMLHFYCEVLGCHIERTLPTDIGLTQLRAGNALIDIVAIDSELGRQGGGAPGKLANNMDHFCLQLAAIDEQQLITYLTQQNVAIEPLAERYGATGFGRSIYVKDPQGNTVELKPIEQ